MNQSDIRGLVRHWRARADIDILRHGLCLLQSRIQSAAGGPIASAGRILLLSCLYLSVPSLFPVFKYQRTTSEEGNEKQFSYHATFLFFRASYSINANHMNPANSLATAVVALQGSLPRLTSLW